MRRLLVPALLILGLTVCVPASLPATAASVKMPRMVCNPTQLLELSKSIGRFVCVTSDLLDNLAVTKPLIETAALSVDAAAHSSDAPGAADPNAITCGLPSNRQRDTQHLYCARNNFWALASTPAGPRFSGPPPDEAYPYH